MSRTKDVVKTHQTRVSPFSKTHHIFLKHKYHLYQPQSYKKTPNKNPGEEVFGTLEAEPQEMFDDEGYPK